MVEKFIPAKEFEYKPYREIEKKYQPVFPDQLNELRSESMPIEQVYLSHPSEEFSLRLRETLRDGQLHYQATLKDRGNLTPDGLNRLEVETDIDPTTFGYCKSREHVALRKLRAEPLEGVAIDWFDDGQVQIESENPKSWDEFLKQAPELEDTLCDVTGERQADNEWRAHLEHRSDHGGIESLKPGEEITPELIAGSIFQRHLHDSQTIVTIAGRSGSGKTTIIRKIQQQLDAVGLCSVVLSTDNYHRGKIWLDNYKDGPWTDWDAPIVYDIEALQGETSPSYKMVNPLLRAGLTSKLKSRLSMVKSRRPRLSSSKEFMPDIHPSTAMPACALKRQPRWRPASAAGYYATLMNAYNLPIPAAVFAIFLSRLNQPMTLNQREILSSRN